MNSSSLSTADVNIYGKLVKVRGRVSILYFWR